MRVTNGSSERLRFTVHQAVAALVLFTTILDCPQPCVRPGAPKQSTWLHCLQQCHSLPSSGSSVSSLAATEGLCHLAVPRKLLPTEHTAHNWRAQHSAPLWHRAAALQYTATHSIEGKDSDKAFVWIALPPAPTMPAHA
jgi:hypothetical protein